MANKTYRGALEEIIILLINDKEEQHKVFLEHSHSIYRNELKQYGAEVKMNYADELISKITEMRDKEYVSNVGGIGEEIEGERKEKEEIKGVIDTGRIDST